MQNTMFCVFLLVSVCRVTSANVEKMNKDLDSCIGNLTEQLNQVTLQQKTLVEKLHFQEDEIKSMKFELEMRKEIIREIMLQVLSKIESHGSTLSNATKNLTCTVNEFNVFAGLNTTYLNGKLYFFSFKQPLMTWYEAQDFCQNHSMQLVSVESQEEWNFIKPEVTKLAKQISLPWSSASDAAEEGRWKWTSTGNDVIFFANRNMKNVTSRNCMCLAPENWFDAICSETTSFICEADSVC